MRSKRSRPVFLSSSYLTLEPIGISMTAVNSAGRCSPGVTSCHACVMPKPRRRSRLPDGTWSDEHDEVPLGKRDLLPAENTKYRVIAADTQRFVEKIPRHQPVDRVRLQQEGREAAERLG